MAKVKGKSARGAKRATAARGGSCLGRMAVMTLLVWALMASAAAWWFHDKASRAEREINDQKLEIDILRMTR